MIEIHVSVSEARPIFCALVAEYARPDHVVAAESEPCLRLPDAWLDELGMYGLEANSGERSKSRKARAIQDSSLVVEVGLAVDGYRVVCRVARPELRGSLRVFVGGLAISGPGRRCADAMFELDEPNSMRAEMVITIDDLRCAVSRSRRTLSSLDVTVAVVT